MTSTQLTEVQTEILRECTMFSGGMIWRTSQNSRNAEILENMGLVEIKFSKPSTLSGRSFYIRITDAGRAQITK